MFEHPPAPVPERTESPRHSMPETGFTFENESFSVYFQPKVANPGNKLVALEALLRTEKGKAAPHALINRARETGAIAALDRKIMEQVLHCIAFVQEEGRSVRVSVNISPQELTPEFAQEVFALLAERGVEPHLLSLEITEEAPITQEGWQALAALHKGGVHLALDDYGSGYATDEAVAQGRELFSEIKIDAALVHTLIQEGRLDEVVTNLRARGYQVVVEGVEDAAMLAQIPEGCLVQGFVHSPAVPWSTITNRYLH